MESSTTSQISSWERRKLYAKQISGKQAQGKAGSKAIDSMPARSSPRVPSGKRKRSEDQGSVPKKRMSLAKGKGKENLVKEAPTSGLTPLEKANTSKGSHQRKRKRSSGSTPGSTKRLRPSQSPQVKEEDEEQAPSHTSDQGPTPRSPRSPPPPPPPVAPLLATEAPLEDKPLTRLEQLQRWKKERQSLKEHQALITRRTTFGQPSRTSKPSAAPRRTTLGGKFTALGPRPPLEPLKNQEATLRKLTKPEPLAKKPPAAHPVKKPVVRAQPDPRAKLEDKSLGRLKKKAASEEKLQSQPKISLPRKLSLQNRANLCASAKRTEPDVKPASEKIPASNLVSGAKHNKTVSNKAAVAPKSSGPNKPLLTRKSIPPIQAKKSIPTTKALSARKSILPTKTLLAKKNSISSTKVKHARKSILPTQARRSILPTQARKSTPFHKTLPTSAKPKSGDKQPEPIRTPAPILKDPKSSMSSTMAKKLNRVSFSIPPCSAKKQVATPMLDLSMREKLEVWLEQKGHSIRNYRHLHCFGHQVSEFRRQQKGKAPAEGEAMPEDDVGASPTLRAKPKKPTVNLESSVDSLREFRGLLQAGFPPNQAAVWLNTMVQVQPELQTVPLLWEVRAMMAEGAGDLAGAMDILNQAVAEPNVQPVLEMAAIIERFLLRTRSLRTALKAQTTPQAKRASGTPRRQPLLESANVFPSTQIRLAKSPARLPKSPARLPKLDSEENLPVLLPVRRCTRLSQWNSHNASFSDGTFDPEHLPSPVRRSTHLGDNPALRL